MTKKKINIVLILLVLGLWGAVFYKSLYQYLFPKEVVLNTSILKTSLLSNLANKDTFLLEPLERDPFLSHGLQDKPTKKVYRSNPIVQKTFSEKQVVIKVWPEVAYYGYIKSKVKNEALVLVKINKKLHKLRKNDAVEGIMVKKVYNDSIEFLMNKEKKVFKISH